MTQGPLPEIEVTRRRLAWRASRRGIKEMDLLVGGFAEKHLPTMTADELDAFTCILDIPDQDLLAWVTRQEQVPPHLESPMLMALLAFRPETGTP